MKRIAGLAAVLALVATACSDSLTNPAKDSPEPVGGSPDVKLAWMKEHGYNTQAGSVNNGTQYIAFPPPLWQSSFGTNLGLTDDSCTQLNFNFPFTFFGRQFTRLWVGSNGYVTFAEVSPGTCYANFVPDFPPPGGIPMAAIWWNDWNPGTGGAVFANVTGQPGSRRIVITWSGVPEFPATGSNTFQMQLLERLGVIVFSYSTMTATATHFGPTEVSGLANGTVGFGGFPGIFVVAKGSALVPLRGTTQCLVYLNGSYRLFSDLVCALFVF